MEEVKQIFDRLQSTSGRIDKENIIKENADKTDFRNTLHFLLNPFIVTGLSSKKIDKKVNVKATWIFDDADCVMVYLTKNNTGTDEIIANVQNFISQQPIHMRDFYKGIFTKSLKLGCAANTANKILGKQFVPKFECMLAEAYFDHASKIEGKEFTVTQKLDGIRCIAIKEDGEVSLFSRQGQPIEGLLDIEEELNNHPCEAFAIDGELLVTNTTDIPSKEQYKATMQIVRKDGIKHGVTFWIFDYLDVSEFKKCHCAHLYSERRDLLERQFADLQNIKILPSLYTGGDINRITELLDELRERGEEGVMININDAPYEFKRTRYLLKAKVMQDCDLQIIGFEEGQGRLAGTLGRLNVDYKGNVLGVGGGFTDEQRQYFWSNQEHLMGRVVKVQYFEETQDKDGNLSLRFPVFKELREVGKCVSYV